MFHGTLTVITKIRPDAVEDLRLALKRLDQSIQAREPHPLREIDELYFAHWGISGDAPPCDPPSTDCYLLFGADLRLTRSLHGREQLRAAVTLLVDRIAAQAPGVAAVFDALYTHCEDYPLQGMSDPERVKQYLITHAAPYNTRHIDFAYRVATVPDIRELTTARARVEGYLNERHRFPFLERWGEASVRGALREQFDARFTRVSDSEWRRSLSAALRTAALATLTYFPLDAPLRMLFQLKNRLARPRKTVEHVTVPDSLRERIEARQGPVQNSMILVSDVPGSWLGRFRQWFFMTLINWRLQRNVVGLNDIRTIHFARWALFQRGTRRQLLFMVTYDESWESYIDAFVDHEDVNTFLKLIWRGTKGFPSGLPFVAPFKQWIRSVQCPSLVHYSAFLHGGERPQPFALTDLHELSELRRVLATEGARGVEAEASQRALEVFLQEGRFPYQDKLLSPRQSAALLWGQLRTALRPLFTSSRSVPHATAAPMDLVPARTAPRGHRSEGSAPYATGEAGRRPGTHRVWLQTHGGRHLPAAQARGRRTGTSVAARDPEGRAHDGGTDPS